jgi:hypothetical protein
MRKKGMWEKAKAGNDRIGTIDKKASPHLESGSLPSSWYLRCRKGVIRVPQNLLMLHKSEVLEMMGTAGGEVERGKSGRPNSLFRYGF